MTVAQHDAKYWSQRREEWLDRVESLLQQIEKWATSQGWPVRRETRTIEEKYVGSYEAPALVLTLPAGELSAEPIAMRIIKGDGRVDLQGYPTLNRVMLLSRGDDWVIMTESNVPLHADWNQQTFIRLAPELLE